ncbi:MAG TPA: transglycosylase family protein [Mycobacteriales bacterium]|nr:transglycosylase family protein [Mycobacteriales bacterium]
MSIRRALVKRHTPRHARPSRARTVAAGVATTTAALGASVAVAAPAEAHDRSFPTMLAQLRQCESGGNYSINTGNGYYGAYQFNLSTWRGVGGSGYPHQNPPSVQDEMATRLYESRGWSPWPSCSQKMGLHATTVTRPWAGAAPQGAFDSAQGVQGGIRVAGWAFDRDISGPIRVHVYVDGRGAAGTTAGNHRPDVQRAHGRGEYSGFAVNVPAGEGRRHVCVYAIGAGGGGNTHLGCRDVVVPRRPIGVVDSVEVVPGGVRVTGWTLDLDTPAQSTRAHFYVDGEGAASATADRPRPDVARAYGVPEARGYSVVVPAGSDICSFAIDTTGTAAHRLLDCQSPTGG